MDEGFEHGGNVINMDKFIFSEPMQLHSAPKWDPKSGQHRVLPPKETYKHVRPLMPLIEVTRIADITGLDRLGIPAFEVIRPCAEGGVFSHQGKGLTKVEACVSGMMEALERYSAERLNCKPLIGTYEEVSQYCSAMDPRLMYLYETQTYDEKAVLDWVPGTDLLTGERKLVPANFVVTPWFGPGAEFWMTSTNGLASGNVMEEAVCHALAEMIERDAYTLSVVRSLSREKGISRLLKSRILRASEEPFLDIDLEDLPEPLNALIERVEKAGMQIYLKDITSDLGIPCFSAAIREEVRKNVFFLSQGFGAHPNAKVAAIRAVTECAIQRYGGPRKPGIGSKAYLSNKITPWWWIKTSHTKSFDSVPSYENDDILDDIHLMLSRLRKIEVSHIIAVDLTIERLGVPVVRLIIPELECWCLTHFDPNQCRLGKRAKRFQI